MVFKFDLYCHCIVFQNSKQDMISEISKVYTTRLGVPFVSHTSLCFLHWATLQIIKV